MIIVYSLIHIHATFILTLMRVHHNKFWGKSFLFLNFLVCFVVGICYCRFGCRVSESQTFSMPNSKCFYDNFKSFLLLICASEVNFRSWILLFFQFPSNWDPFCMNDYLSWKNVVNSVGWAGCMRELNSDENWIQKLSYFHVGVSGYFKQDWC